MLPWGDVPLGGFSLGGVPPWRCGRIPIRHANKARKENEVPGRPKSSGRGLISFAAKRYLAGVASFWSPWVVLCVHLNLPSKPRPPFISCVVGASPCLIGMLRALLVGCVPYWQFVCQKRVPYRRLTLSPAIDFTDRICNHNNK